MEQRFNELAFLIVAQAKPGYITRRGGLKLPRGAIGGLITIYKMKWKPPLRRGIHEKGF
jgi:hypothetical protein